ncbi:uncharacterized protein LOC116162606 [Photinus pyralis]|uniref:uncharacterized protein LOC116162606 n=1 Tax=Photinus pyralis TaxID=7054 RepID=UPI0012675AAB|nr:uncharacterized protein LOC116162606 [Photinus pyralis]
MIPHLEQTTRPCGAGQALLQWSAQPHMCPAKAGMRTPITLATGISLGGVRRRSFAPSSARVYDPRTRRRVGLPGSPLTVLSSAPVGAAPLPESARPVVSGPPPPNPKFPIRSRTFYKWIVQKMMRNHIHYKMIFCTALDRIPPCSFITQPTIQFLHNVCPHPKGNTCGLELYLPTEQYK